MTSIYPIILTPSGSDYVVTVPDLEINTEGCNINDAMRMAEDAVCLTGISMQDLNQSIPMPSDYQTVLAQAGKDDIVTLISVDFDAYRRRTDNRSVKKNCTIPAWLNDKAMKAGINFSALLQAAIKAELNL